MGVASFGRSASEVRRGTLMARRRRMGSRSTSESIGSTDSWCPVACRSLMSVSVRGLTVPRSILAMLVCGMSTARARSC